MHRRPADVVELGEYLREMTPGQVRNLDQLINAERGTVTGDVMNYYDGHGHARRYFEAFRNVAGRGQTQRYEEGCRHVLGVVGKTDQEWREHNWLGVQMLVTIVTTKEALPHDDVEWLYRPFDLVRGEGGVDEEWVGLLIEMTPRLGIDEATRTVRRLSERRSASQGTPSTVLA